MLSDQILKTVAEYADGMVNPVSIILNLGEHKKRQELIEFLRSVARVSKNINFLERDLAEDARSPLTFAIEANGEMTGISFSGIPGGHEFNSFVLALLQSGGTEIKLEDGLKRIIENISDQLSFEIFVSLSCHNCPEVVQSINQFALLNKNISSEMIDGGLFQEIIEERKIQGVPSVYLNGELFASGRVEIASVRVGSPNSPLALPVLGHRQKSLLSCRLFPLHCHPHRPTQRMRPGRQTSCLFSHQRG